ncbi:MAG: FtsW/RodA/SpoVE family cell cycle protein, partial [Candidatus Contubernalis sp.]|nr:FtsW/RodA/SpoVE family cell cycle protein [Candidatus Contubernalis sp.]
MNDLLESTIQLLDGYLTKFTDIFVSVGNLLAEFEVVAEIYTLVVRWVFPILALAIFLRCILPLLREGKGKAVWGYLCMTDGTRLPVKNWENLIGRSKFSDIVINLPFVSRSHAVLTFHNGIWSIADLGSKGGVEVNGGKIEKLETVNYGDIISLSGAEMVLTSAEGESMEQEQQNDTLRSSPSSRHIRTGVTLFLILIFQILGGFQVCFSMGAEVNPAVPLALLIFILAECLHYIAMQWCSRKYFELELLCYFLCGLNLLIVASAAPDTLYKQLAAILTGIVVYTAIKLIIGNLGRAHKLKYYLMVSAVVLMILNLAIGETYFGAKRWINLGFITFQPMEFVKIAFVMAGTATLDKLLTTRNMTAFIAFSGACIGTLVLIRDFGTAVVIFGTFIVIAFMQSGDLRTIALVTAGAIFGSTAVVSFMPYI